MNYYSHCDRCGADIVHYQVDCCLCDECIRITEREIYREAMGN